MSTTESAYSPQVFVIAEEQDGSVVVNGEVRHREVRRQQAIVGHLQSCTTYGDVRRFVAAEPSAADVVDNYVEWFLRDDDGPPAEALRSWTDDQWDDIPLNDLSDDAIEYLPRLTDATECDLPDDLWDLLDIRTPIMAGGDLFSVKADRLPALVQRLQKLGYVVNWESDSGELVATPPAEPASLRHAMGRS